MYRQLTDVPKRLATPNLVNVKLRSATVSNDIKGLLVTAGGTREFARPFDYVGAHHVLWIRDNAVLTTICCIM